MENSAGLTAALLVNPDDVKPRVFDFGPHMDKEPKKAKKSPKDTADDQAAEVVQGLPRRLRLSAFSKCVGHRPTGLQVSQVKLFSERFPTEFRETAMQRFVLPHWQGLPFVAADGGLPSPALSTTNALRWLEAAPEALEKGDAAAVAQIKRIQQKGVQVEWMEVKAFLHWQLHVEGSAVQASVQVAPHILDTAMKFVSFIRSPFASSQGQAKTEKELEAAFQEFLQGKSVHRLRDAKALLQSTEVPVLKALALWRKGAHYLHANSLAQVYFLSVPEWHALKGKSVTVDDSEHSLQLLVAEQLMRAIGEAEIVNSGEVPKLKKAAMNIHLFKEYCEAVTAGSKYKELLQVQYSAVWKSVSLAERLFKRLLIVGESSLRAKFMRGLAVAGGVEHLHFDESDPTGDFANMVSRLATAWRALADEKKAEEQATEMPQAPATQAPADAGPTGATADEATEPWASPGTRSPGPSAATASLAPSQAQSQSAGEAGLDAVLARARLAFDEMITLYERTPTKGDIPAFKKSAVAGTLWVVPSPATSRGLPGRAVAALRAPGTGCSLARHAKFPLCNGGRM